MATITLTGPEFYNKGVGGASSAVGNDYGAPRVVRYLFTAPSTGAAHVAVSFGGNSLEAGVSAPSLRYFIGSDPESHAQGGPDSVYTGELTLGEDYATYTGEGDILLVPNAAYYLWVFPANAEHAWIYWNRSTDFAALEATGHAGCARIGPEGKRYLVAIHDGTANKLYLPAAYDGEKWKLQS